MSFPFDDYLNLLSKSLKDHRFVGFIGCSGAGKSSYIDFLLAQHPDFQNREVIRILEGRPLNWSERVPYNPCLIVVDELLVVRDLWRVARLMRAGHRLIVASHLPRFWHWPLRLFGPMKQFQIDGIHQKVVNALEKRQVQFNQNAVDEFVRKYGANYTDLDLILESCPTSDLGKALQYFNRYYTIEKVRNQ